MCHLRQKSLMFCARYGCLTFDPALAAADTVEIVVQIKGKIRARLNVSASATKDELEAAALDAVASELSGKQVMKVIVVPGKLVNIVAKYTISKPH